MKCPDLPAWLFLGKWWRQEPVGGEIPISPRNGSAGPVQYQTGSELCLTRG